MKALVVIPTYNEEHNIRNITREVLAVSDLTDVLIIDDNSPDGTGDIADGMSAEEPRIKVMHRTGKLGLGSAYIAGFRYALANGYDYIMEMDADYSHDPKEIPNFLAAIKESDLVVGSRYVGGIRILNWPMNRLLLSYSAGVYTRMITGLKLLDCTSGFKCFRRETLESLDLSRIHSDGYSFQIEMSFLCQDKGFKLKEIPIVFTERKEGHSKMSSGIIFEALFIVWLLKVKSILRIL
jgi:dolichol-phosphate mannosyltransferase